MPQNEVRPRAPRPRLARRPPLQAHAPLRGQEAQPHQHEALERAGPPLARRRRRPLRRAGGPPPPPREAHQGLCQGLAPAPRRPQGVLQGPERRLRVHPRVLRRAQVKTRAHTRTHSFRIAY